MVFDRRRLSVSMSLAGITNCKSRKENFTVPGLHYLKLNDYKIEHHDRFCKTISH